MSGKTGRAEHRVTKNEYLRRTAQRTQLPLRVVSLVYGALIDELLEVVGEGESLLLSGFGRFYPQTHKGHVVRSGRNFDEKGSTEISDYNILKFSAVQEVNKKVGAPKPPTKSKDSDAEDSAETLKGE